MVLVQIRPLSFASLSLEFERARSRRRPTLSVKQAVFRVRNLYIRVPGFVLKISGPGQEPDPSRSLI